MALQTHYLHRDGRTYPFRNCTAAPSLTTQTVKSAEYQKIFTDDGPVISKAGTYTSPNAASPYPDNTYRSKVDVVSQKGVALIPTGSVTIEKLGSTDGITTRVSDTGIFASVGGFSAVVSDHKNPTQALRVDDITVSFWSVPTNNAGGTDARSLIFPYMPGDIFSNAPELGDDDDTPDA